MSLPSINLLQLTAKSMVKSRSHHDVAYLHPIPMKDQLPAARLDAHLDTMGENNTPTATKGCEVKSNFDSPHKGDIQLRLQWRHRLSKNRGRNHRLPLLKECLIRVSALWEISQFSAKNIILNEAVNRSSIC